MASIVPRKDPVFDVLMPAMEDIARAIAKKYQVRIRPAGPYAPHRLGHSSHLSTKLVYLTDGPRDRSK